MIIEDRINIEEIKRDLLECFPKIKTGKNLDREEIIKDINNISCYEDIISVISQINKYFTGYKYKNIFATDCDIKHDLSEMNILCENLKNLIFLANKNNEIIKTEISTECCSVYYKVVTRDSDGLIQENEFPVETEYNTNVKEETLIFCTWKRAKLSLPYSINSQNYIKQLRKQTGLSQAEFAKKFHISKGTLTNWEQGLRTPPEYVLFIIETLLKQEEALNNISSRILDEKNKDRSRYYSEEICQTGKNAFNTALDIINEEKKKITESM